MAYHHIISYKNIQYFEDRLTNQLSDSGLINQLTNRYHADYVVIQRKIFNESDWHERWFQNLNTYRNSNYFYPVYCDENFLLLKAK